MEIRDIIHFEGIGFVLIGAAVMVYTMQYRTVYREQPQEATALLLVFAVLFFGLDYWFQEREK